MAYNLLKGEHNKDLRGKYPELNDNLKRELEIFMVTFSSDYSFLKERRQLFVKRTIKVRSIFPQVEHF